MHSLFSVIDVALNLYSWAVIGYALLSWLISFDVVNRNNRFVYALYDTLNRLVDPALRYIRRVIPSIGGIDISPVVLLLLIMFLRNLLREYRLVY